MEKHILILTHGNFGAELLKSVEMIIGPVDNITTGSLMPGMPPESFLETVTSLVHPIDDDTEILCLVDLFGGSPCNTALRVNYDRSMGIISGLNLPMLIEIISQRDSLEMEELIRLGVNTAHDGCFDVLAKKKKEA